MFDPHKAAATLLAMSFPRLLRMLAAAGALAAILTSMPASTVPALAQSPGDEQYADPIVGDGDGRSGQSAPPPPRDEPAPAPTVPSAPATGVAPSDVPSTSPPATEAAPSDGSALPRTGADVGLLAATGFALASLGLFLRLRPAARMDR